MEISIFQKFDNDHILKMTEAFETQKNIYIVTEYCNGSDLKELMKEIKTMTQVEAKVYLRQSAKAFHDLSQKEVIHRDLKLENILLHFPGRDMELVTVTPG